MNESVRVEPYGVCARDVAEAAELKPVRDWLMALISEEATSNMTLA